MFKVNKKLYLAVALVLGLSLSAFAEDATQSTQIPVQSEISQAKAVKLVEIKGNKSISTNTIISKMKTRIGGPYLENVISDDLKRLYLLGFFSDIKIDTEDYKGGIKVIVTLTERPIIESIAFSGIKRIVIREKKLKETLKSKEGQYLDYPTLSEDVATLKSMYEKKGFGQAKVDYTADVDKAANKAKVQFSVVEGKRFKVKAIFVEGNKTFSNVRILKLLKTKKAWLFNPGVLNDEVLAEDMERIKSFYRREGFADLAVDYEVKSDEKKPFLYLTIKVQEGRKYLVGVVSISGNQDTKEREILAKIKECQPGKVFSQDGLKQDLGGIQGLYFDRGYVSAEIEDTTSLNPDTGRVDIAYNITENQIAYVDKIKIRGNARTKDIVIRRELRINPGDRFDGEKLKRSKERLQNLGFFEEVSYDTEDTGTPDKKDLVVEIKEAKTGSFSFGGGYSTVDQFIGFIEVEQKNFDWRNWPYFTGDGQDLRIRASLGSLINDIDVSFTKPWMFDYPVSFGFDAYRRSRERDSDVGYGYDQVTTGGDLRLGKELTDHLRTDLIYVYNIIDIKNVTSDATEDLKSEVGKKTVSSLAPSITFDTRDNVFNPTRGNVVAGTVEWAGGFLGGDKDYVKLSGRASHYVPLFNGSVLEFRGRIGIADPYGNTDKVPIYERFFAGGASTIRGYKERKVGPVDPVSKDPLGGEAMLIGNIEYTYPLFDFLKVAAFYDMGNVWEKMGDVGKGGFKSGLGFGLRIKTPVAPITLDFGIPFNKASGEDSKGGGEFYFSTSKSF